MTVSSEPIDWAERFLGGGSVAGFDRDARERSCAHFAGAITEEETRRTFDLARLQSILSADEAPVASTDLFDGTHLIRLSDVHHRTGRSPYAVVLEQLEQGVTLRLRAVERVDRTVRAITDSLADVLEGAASANLYLTPAARDGFSAHFDNTDVFVLQLYGQKSWRLYDHYSNHQALPLRETPWDARRYVPSDEGRALTLSPGDVLYVPRGAMHAAACTTSASMHLTFSLDPATVLDTLTDALRTWATQEITLRQRAGGGAFERSAPALLRQFADDIESRSVGELSNRLPAGGTVPEASTVSLEELLRAPDRGP